MIPLVCFESWQECLSVDVKRFEAIGGYRPDEDGLIRIRQVGEKQRSTGTDAPRTIIMRIAPARLIILPVLAASVCFTALRFQPLRVSFLRHGCTTTSLCLCLANFDVADRCLSRRVSSDNPSN